MEQSEIPARVKINKTFFKYIQKDRAVKETEGPLKNGKGNLLTQVLRALFKGKKKKPNEFFAWMCKEKRGQVPERDINFPEEKEKCLKKLRSYRWWWSRNWNAGKLIKKMLEQTWCIPKV